MFYTPSFVRRLKLGTVVADTSKEVVTNEGGPDLGHIIGFDVSRADKLLVIVKFARAGEATVYPSNLTIFD